MKTTPKIKPSGLSLRTQMEQAAGRGAVQEAVNYELLMAGDHALAKMFPSYLRNPHLYRPAENPDVWMVDVRMQIANGECMNLTTPFLGFPSDLLITQMALLEP